MVFQFIRSRLLGPTITYLTHDSPNTQSTTNSESTSGLTKLKKKNSKSSASDLAPLHPELVRSALLGLDNLRSSSNSFPEIVVCETAKAIAYHIFHPFAI